MSSRTPTLVLQVHLAAVRAISDVIKVASGESAQRLSESLLRLLSGRHTDSLVLHQTAADQLSSIVRAAYPSDKPALLDLSTIKRIVERLSVRVLTIGPISTHVHVARPYMRKPALSP